MEYQSGQVGRVFFARFDHGEDLLAGLEKLVRRERIRCGWFQLFGGLGSTDVVTGPRQPTVPPDPVWQKVDDTREVLGAGSVFWGEKGPLFHLHAAMGHHGHTLTGCVRKKAQVYLVIEMVLFELGDMEVTRPWFAEGGFNRPAIKDSRIEQAG
jgi:predicted DNA-binding protein with PD1-like motif